VETSFFKKVEFKIRFIFTMSIEFIIQFRCREICTKTVRYLQSEDNELHNFSEA